MMYISKMVPTSDKGRFYAFGRVFSGRVSIIKCQKSYSIIIVLNIKHFVCTFVGCYWYESSYYGTKLHTWKERRFI